MPGPNGEQRRKSDGNLWQRFYYGLWMEYVRDGVMALAIGFAALALYFGLKDVDETKQNVQDIQALRAKTRFASAQSTFANCVATNRTDRHNEEQDRTLVSLIDAATDTRAETFAREAVKQRKRLRERIHDRTNDQEPRDRRYPRDCYVLPTVEPFAHRLK